VRAAVAAELAWLGVAVDDQGAPTADGAAREVTAGAARVRTFVVPAREDLQLATEALAAVDR
jgi:acetate kinase